MSDDELPAKCSVSIDDGPVAFRGTPQWNAWEDYYKRARLHFHLKTMRHYRWRELDWPVPFDMPPTSVNWKNRMPWPHGENG